MKHYPIVSENMTLIRLALSQYREQCRDFYATSYQHGDHASVDYWIEQDETITAILSATGGEIAGGPPLPPLPGLPQKDTNGKTVYSSDAGYADSVPN